jgi:uncharacterized protein YukJ
MPLSNGYGVLIGKIERHFIDPPDNEGRWPHYHIQVKKSNGEIFESAINLKSRTQIRVEYRDFRNIDKRHFKTILEKEEGLHRISRNSQSGALDFVRHPGLKDPFCPFSNDEEKEHSASSSKHRCNCTRWWLENGLNTVKLMQYYIDSAERVFIFGEPYANGKGIHNVHMTQGDPIDSEFADEDGIWQDGGVIFQYFDPQPRLLALITKFQTQSLNTDNNGRPI